MTAPIHTYGPKCLLSDDDPDLSAWYNSPSPPKIRAQFFYTSSLPIDDPLSPLPPPSSGQGAGNERAPPHPFSARDNIALENAWRELRRTWEQGQSKPKDGATGRNRRITVPRREFDIERRRKADSRDNVSLTESHGSSPRVSTSFLDDQLPNFRPRPNDEVGSLEARSKGSRDGRRMRSMQGSEPRDIHQGHAFSFRKRAGSSLGYDPKSVRRKTSSSPYEDNASFEDVDSGSLHGNPSRDVSISGSPFIRAPLSQPQTPLGRSVESSTLRDVDEDLQHEPHGRGSSHAAPRPSTLRASLRQGESPENSLLDTEADSDEQNTQLTVPVGASRLHLVELPNLKVYSLLAYWKRKADQW